MRKQPASPIKDKRLVWDMQDYLKHNANQPKEGMRNYMLFTTGVMTGYRAGDLVELRVRDVREALERGYFLISENKTEHLNKPPRKAEITQKLRRELKAYVSGKEDSEWMFPSRKGKSHITVQSFSDILKEAASHFGLRNITCHSMRKTYAYQIYQESGKDIMIVSQLLCHKSFEWTKRYIGLEEETFHQAVQCLQDFVR